MPKTLDGLRVAILATDGQAFITSLDESGNPIAVICHEPMCKSPLAFSPYDCSF